MSGFLWVDNKTLANINPISTPKKYDEHPISLTIESTPFQEEI